MSVDLIDDPVADTFVQMFALSVHTNNLRVISTTGMAGQTSGFVVARSGVAEPSSAQSIPLPWLYSDQGSRAWCFTSRVGQVSASATWTSAQGRLNGSVATWISMITAGSEPTAPER